MTNVRNIRNRNYPTNNISYYACDCFKNTTKKSHYSLPHFKSLIVCELNSKLSVSFSKNLP
uniref:Uncharacterized protein n=1 Tax=uncultured marine virus TaxID=186617 RepID=A0A0F7L9H7_9VIRU|nr:hypothetical protein [uncultured marine virus]